MRNFRELLIYQKSYTLSLNTYRATINLCEKEKYGIGHHLRRTITSIPSNIAEGSSRESNKDFIRFLQYALGSAFESETQLKIIQDLQLITTDISPLLNELQEVQKLLNVFISKVKKL